MSNGKTVEVDKCSEAQAIAVVANFFKSEIAGRIGFEKEGESFSLWATSEVETT